SRTGSLLVSLQGGPVNVARLGTASQSSTAFGGDASRAIDGSTDGSFSNGSVTHTDNQPGSWWQVQRPAARPLPRVVLFNRADGNGQRLSNFTVTVYNGSAVAFQQAYFQAGSVGQGGSFSIALPEGVKGDRVRVQLNGVNNEGNGYLSLAEV